MSRRSVRVQKFRDAMSASASASAPALTSTSQPTQTASTHVFASASAWESWLEINHATTRALGVWLQIAKKSAAAPTVTYDEALDTALCYGWIDGQRRRCQHSAQHFLQRFTPRRRGSMWSQRNVDKVTALEAAGRMRAPGRAEVEAAQADGRWARAYAGSSTMAVPNDFAAALAENEAAGSFFDSLGKTQRYLFLWRIETSKRQDTRLKRIAQFIEMLGRKETLPR